MFDEAKNINEIEALWKLVQAVLPGESIDGEALFQKLRESYAYHREHLMKIAPPEFNDPFAIPERKIASREEIEEVKALFAKVDELSEKNQAFLRSVMDFYNKADKITYKQYLAIKNMKGKHARV